MHLAPARHTCRRHAGSALWAAANYTYSAAGAAAADGFVAWLNDKTANSSLRAVHVTLPSGTVLRGSASLALPIGLNLVLQGQGMGGAQATTLNLNKENLDVGGMLGNSGRIEFRNMTITNVRAAAVRLSQVAAH